MSLENLLQQCTVKLSIPGQVGWGTGFFVAPGLILTCAHVVKALVAPDRAKVQWQQQLDFAEAELLQYVPELDLALLQFTLKEVDLLPCVYLDEAVQVGQDFYFFGYPDEDFEYGCPVTGSCEGLTGDVSPLIKFKQAQVRPGMSGSALLNRQTGKVCGMVKFTRNRDSDWGGGAIPSRVILEHFPQLRELQQLFHERDRRWVDLITNRQSEIDFQPYLQSIATTYERWWQLYTLTNAEGRQRQKQEESVFFDFGLMIQTVQRGSQKTQNQEEKVERFPVLEGLLKYAEQHVLLVGRPGSGKSTALARLLLEQSTQQRRIPVLVELRYLSGSIEKLILDSFAQHGLLLKADQLEIALLQSLMLFDGVNELPSEESRSQLFAFRRNHLRIHMIFTTRDLSLGGDLGIEKKLEMLPLTELQMRKFIQAYIPEQAEKMLQQLKDRLQEFGQTPLLLWMLCSLFQKAGEIPENLGMIFRLFTQGYERNLKQDVVIESDREQWKHILQCLAWKMTQAKELTDLEVAIPRESAVRAIAQFLDGKIPYAEDFARKSLRDLQKYHLIQARTDSEEIEFRHQLIQEYYAAEALLERFAKLDDETLKCNYLNYLKWTEPISLMLAIVEDGEVVVRILKLALEVDLLLAARLATALRTEFQNGKELQSINLHASITNNVGRWYRPRHHMDSARLEEETPRIGEHPLLSLHRRWSYYRNRHFANTSRTIINSTGSTYEFLSQADGVIGASSFTDYDLDYDLEAFENNVLGDYNERFEHDFDDLKSFDVDTRREAVRNLAELKSERAVSELVQVVNDLSMSVRWNVAISLGKIGLKSAVPALIQLIGDPDRTVRRSAIEALSKIDPESFFDKVPHLSLETDPSIRTSLAKFLSSVKSEKAIGYLCELLEETDYDAQRAVMLAFEAHPASLVIEQLKQLVKASKPAVRWNIAEVLGRTASQQAIPELSRLVTDSEPSVRRNVAEALGRIGSQQVIPELSRLVTDSEPSVRQSVAEALGRTASQQAIPELSRLVTDSEPSVRQSVAEALGRTASQQAIPELSRLVTDSEPSVRRNVAEALGRIDSQQAIPDLRQLIKDEDRNVCMETIDVLSKFDSKEALEDLFQVFYTRKMDITTHGMNAASPAYKAFEALQKNIQETTSPKIFFAENLALLQQSTSTTSWEQAFQLIAAIQNNCKFYNYTLTMLPTKTIG
jgi:HEAT repeat protein